MFNVNKKLSRYIIFISCTVAFIFLLAGNLAGVGVSIVFAISGWASYSQQQKEDLEGSERVFIEEKARASLYGHQKANEISSGNLPIGLSFKAMLKKGEICHFSCDADLFEMETLRYSTGSGSARIRVAKGLSINTGSTRAYHTEKKLSKTATGELSLTNQRVIFSGDAKSFEVPIGKVISAESDGEKLVIHHGKESKFFNLSIGQSQIAVAVMKKVISSL